MQKDVCFKCACVQIYLSECFPSTLGAFIIYLCMQIPKVTEATVHMAMKCVRNIVNQQSMEKSHNEDI